MDDERMAALERQNRRMRLALAAVATAAELGLAPDGLIEPPQQAPALSVDRPIDS